MASSILCKTAVAVAKPLDCGDREKDQMRPSAHEDIYTSEGLETSVSTRPESFLDLNYRGLLCDGR